jgi:hypothetical protein
MKALNANFLEELSAHTWTTKAVFEQEINMI